MSSSNRKARIEIEDSKLLLDKNDRSIPASVVRQKDVWGLIASRTEDVRNVRHMALTCRFLYHSTRPLLSKLKLQKLAEWIVVAPTLAHVEKIIDAMLDDPALLFTKVEVVKNRKNQVIKNKTLYQLAYGAGDNDLVRRMEVVFVANYGDQAKAVMEQQRNEMLESQEEYQRNEAACLRQLKELLTLVIAAINAETFDGAQVDNRITLHPETLVAIDIFKVGFANMQPEEIEKGMHFRFSLMQAAYDRYVTLEPHWNYNRCALYEDVVLATLQDYLPVYVAMEESQGLSYQQRTQNPESCKRELALRQGGTNFYDVVNRGSVDFVLPGSCVDIYFGGRVAARRVWGAAARLFKTCVEQKHQPYSPMQPIPHQPPRCIML
jgi:hypothetical protein